MSNQMVSRTQRRMEKKQTLMVLTLLLVGCLVSFSLGVMVGRSGDNSDIVEERIVQQKPASIIEDKEQPTQADVLEEGSVDTELTFYDTLPQGQENALGSGINLPPEENKPAEKSPARVVVTPPANDPAPSPEITVKEPKLPAALEKVASQPVAASSGDYLIQVASVKDRQGAVDLKNRMIAKGYAAFVEQADLGSKGIWHRVYAGPFSTREDAEKKVSALKNDRISSAPLLKRR